MKFIPNNFKYKKIHFSYKKQNNNRYFFLKKGTFGIKSLENKNISHIHLEALRRTIIRKVKKKGKLWILIRPNRPLTKKPIGTRMGKGKGSFSKWVYFVKKNEIILEIKGIEKEIAINLLNNASKKLPIKCKIISKNDI